LFLPADLLVREAARLTGAEAELFEPALGQLAEAGEVAVEERPGAAAVYLPELLEAEREVAGRVLALAQGGFEGAFGADQARACVAGVSGMGGVELSDEQVAAACSALTERITVITGGPGTGKTTLTRVLVQACMALGRRVALAAPTGRAAKRMGELAGHEASTIHRLLAYDPFRGGFTFHESRPLDLDTLIIDESSMVDLPLARDLLRALSRTGQVIFIGDADQLPSVGPGNFFRDLVSSRVVPVHRLTYIFRQAQRSLIVENAHRLIAGEKPILVTWKERSSEDCLFIHSRDPERAADVVIRAVTREIPRLGHRPEHIQVITPMHRGALGVTELNVRLQEALNPPDPRKAQLSVGRHILRAGDRVLQTVNNYDKLVFNGEIGRVASISVEARTAVVAFDDLDVTYEYSELDQLQLAYAMTIHKSQGSEYPVAVIVIHSTHYIMLRRNLLYTALTRAEELALIVGNSAGVMRAAQNAEEMRRHTRLAERLRGEAPLAGPREQPDE
ncbi:MAG TPA: AAA family ATPase, partial [Armatimonadota bacterium]|nr:AAA family ATPase [Armatimonadota bacterium]